MTHVNYPVGALDTQSSVNAVEPVNYVDALNILNNRLAAYPFRGTESISMTGLPTGSNRIVSHVEDLIERKVIFLAYNSSGNHWVGEYRNAVFRVLGLLPGLNFLSNRYFDSISIIDSDYVSFTDGFLTPSGLIDGHLPKRISVKRTDRAKNLLHVISFETSAFVVGNVITLRVVNNVGVDIIPTTPVYTVLIGDTPAVVVSAVQAAIATLSLIAPYTPGDLYMDGVRHPTSGSRVIMGGGAHAIPDNYYREGITENEITVARPFPKTPPIVSYVKDATVSNTRVQNSFQFRYRYQFFDEGYSKWGAVSLVPSNFYENDDDEHDNDERFTKIRISIEDELLENPNWRSLIKSIDIAVKETGVGVWRYAAQSIPLKKHLLDDLKVDFLGLGAMPVVPSDEASAPDEQALGNQDFVPLKALSHETTYDRQGRFFTVWGSIQEGFDLPDARATLLALSANLGTPDPAGPQISERRTMKSGGRYRVGVIYENLTYQSPVLPLGEVNIPFQQAAGNNGDSIRITMNTNAPSWATHYRFAVSKNQNQTQYAQIPFGRVTYWIINPHDNTAVSTTYAAGNATHVGFAAMRKQVEADAFRNVLFDQNETDGRVFIPSRGNRMHIVRFASVSGLNQSNLTTYDFPIDGYCLTWPAPSSEDFFTIFIEAKDFYPNFSGGFTPGSSWILGEIYKQAQSEDPLYYELGPVFEVVLELHTVNPVTLTDYGDAYVVERLFPWQFTTIGTFQSIDGVQVPELHRWSTIPHSDHGRPCIDDPNHKRRFEYDKIRSSDAYVSGSEINGLSSFRGTSHIKVNRDNGPIQRMVMIDGILVCISSVRTQPIYVGKSQVLDLSGNTLVGRTSELFTIADELKYDLGTQHPRSVVVGDGAVYGWDGMKGVIWRFAAGAGQFPISDYSMSDSFAQRARDIQKYNLLESVVAGYHRGLAMLLMSFGGAESRDHITIPPDTWGFEEQMRGNQGNRFVSRYSFSPDRYVNIGSELIGVRVDALWRHDRGSYCNFYGTQAACYVKVVVNSEPELVKLLMRITIDASTKWEVTDVYVLPTANYTAGMRSQLIGNKLSLYEGQWMGDFLRDQTDPHPMFSVYTEPERTIRALLNGRPLRGTSAVLTIQLLAPSAYSELRKIITTFEVSKIV